MVIMLKIIKNITIKIIDEKWKTKINIKQGPIKGLPYLIVKNITNSQTV